MVRCKFRVAAKREAGDGTGEVTLYPVVTGSPENDKFYKYTPGGAISFSTINVEAMKVFNVGAEFYVDFTPAE